MLTRRKFAGDLCAAVVGAILESRSAIAAPWTSERKPHIKFPVSPRERMAVGSYPFRAYIVSPTNADRNPKVPGVDLRDFAAHVVEKFGVHNIEPYNFHFSSLEPEYLASCREALAKTKAQAVNIAVDIEKSYYDADRATRKEVVAYAKKWVDVAVSIGSPSVRTSISTAANTSPNVANAVESLREVARYAAEKDVVVNLENDGLVSEDAFFLVRVIEGANNPYLHALPDFANSMMSGDVDFNYRAVRALFQHAYCICHVKDADTDEHGKEFPVDVAKTFQILKSSGYRGYCSIEYSGLGDPYEPTKKLIEQSIHHLS
jgi:sugar phosphate isomerase/epimerase